MGGSDEKEQIKKKVSETNTFTVPFTYDEIKDNYSISTYKPSNTSLEQGNKLG